MADWTSDKPSRSPGDPGPASDASDFADLFNVIRRVPQNATDGQVPTWDAANAYLEPVTPSAEVIVQAVQPAVPLAYESAGRLLAVHVEPGDAVQPGDLIATLDDTQAHEAERDLAAGPLPQQCAVSSRQLLAKLLLRHLRRRIAQV